MVFLCSVLSSALAISRVAEGAVQPAAEDTLMLQKKASIVKSIFEDIGLFPSENMQTWVRYLLAKRCIC
jgi:hypothetical protein